MGTRSLTRVIETYIDKEKSHKNLIITMYRQFDGYPSCYGTELADFLKDGTVVNGLGSNDPKKVFNGAGCLAAQMVAHFKKGAGGFYLYPNNTKDAGQEYEYHVLVDFNTKEITLKCFEVGYMTKRDTYCNKNKLLFSGHPKDFETFVKERETENA